MKKSLLILIVNCIVVSSVLAQQAVFSVLLNKGQNSYGIEENYHPVLLGSALGTNDLVNVEDGGYVALVHESTGASLELTKKGNYSVVEMEQKVLDQPSTVLAKYAKFLIKKFQPDENGRQNLNVTGAVERGEIGIIDVELPNVNDLYGDQVIISWNQTDDIQDYLITVKDKLDEAIIETPVRGTLYKLDLDRAELKGEKMIIINVKATYNNELRSPDYGLKRLDKQESKSISNEFASLKTVAGADNVVDKLLIASFFEENKLLADAITFYKEAQSISPDPDGLNILYNNFLVRNGLKN